MLGIALFATLLALPAPQEGPPGLVLVKGGKTKIGSTVDEVEKLVEAHQELKDVLASQTPQHSRDVDDFFLMPTEVTNEQYIEFVKATGARPPRSWGVEALQAGQAAFLQEQGKAKQEAKAAGQPFETKIFDPDKWWNEHWSESKWEIPDGQALFPVVFVNYAEAQAYARWAGLRLMTEFEYQRAARGDTTRLYPWGNEWDDTKYCQSLHAGKDLTAPVGSFPAGAVDGIFDLSGNVWEWTSSPFTEYPGYKNLRFGKKRPIECLAPFDANQRVTVSGSYQMPEYGVRVATRMYTDRNQTTSALGFRCAASVAPSGIDPSNWMIEKNLNLQVLGAEAKLAPEVALALRRWTSTKGTSEVAGYAVITGYEDITMCPREDIRATSTNDLGSISTKDGPIILGAIRVPYPMLKPELDAGIYYVGWRAAGKLAEPAPEAKDSDDDNPAGSKQDAVPLQQVLGFTPDSDVFLFYTADGVPQVAFEAPPVKSEKMRTGSIKNEPFVPPPPESLPKDAPPPVPIDTLRFTLTVQSATSKSKGFIFDLPVLVKPGTYDASWK